MKSELEVLVETAAAVYGPIATATIAHSKAANLREQSIQACVDDALMVAGKLMAGAKARLQLAQQTSALARSNGHEATSPPSFGSEFGE